jgi:hypothetical protein
VKVQGRGNRHHQRLELVVEAIRRVNPRRIAATGFREEDCIPSAPRPIDEMWSELEAGSPRSATRGFARLLGEMVAAAPTGCVSGRPR